MFKPGQKKPAGSGRTKGVKNKKFLPQLEQYLAERDINPIEEILKIINDPSQEPELRLNGWKTILSYCYAKPDRDEGVGDSHPLIPDDDTPTAELLRLVQ